jgi:hypothetical protein
MGRTVNKSGDKRGVESTNDHQFTKDSETQKKATATKKAKAAARKAGTLQIVDPKTIQKSPAITETRQHTITPEIQQEIADQLTNPDANGHIWYKDFIENFLTTAKNDPNSRAAGIMANVMFKESLLETLDKKADENQQRNIDFQLYRIRQTLYDRQQEVFDNDMDKFIMNMSGRRSGKSELNQRLIIKAALKNKDSICLYLNRNFDNAISQGYDTMVKILDELQIPYTGSRGNGVITFTNGTEVYYRGASNTVDIDKFRGISKLDIAICDESGHLKGLRYLINEVIQPATIDIKGTIILTGTPPRSKNYCWQLWHNNQANIKRYNWNFMSNPFIPDRDNVLQNVAEMNGVPIDSAFIRREYLGDMDALDDDARVISLYTEEEPPKSPTFDRAYIGVDYGYEDNAAIIAMVTKGKKAWCVKEFVGNKLSVTELCTKIREIYDYVNENYNLRFAIQVITDNNEKAITKELRVVYKIPGVRCAYKYDKTFAIEQLKDFLSNKTICIQPKSFLNTEFENTLWKRDDETDKIIYEIDDDNYHPNLMFALLYISRQFAYEVMSYTTRNKSAEPIQIEPGFSYQEPIEPRDYEFRDADGKTVYKLPDEDGFVVQEFTEEST